MADPTRGVQVQPAYRLMAAERDAKGRFVGKGKRPKAALPAAAHGRKDAAAAGPSETFLTELQTSWERHGAATIETVRVDRPHDYLRLIASSLARPTEGKNDALDELSDDEVADELRRILDRLDAPGVENGARVGAAEAAEPPGGL